MYNYYLVLDFECTCEKARSPKFKNEIIEFPVVLLNAQTKIIEDEFRMFVKPTENPRLTDFCTELTGIEQSDIENAETLDIVLEHLDEWILSKNLDSFIFLTDGPWDFTSFLYAECRRKGIERRHYFDQWVNVRWSFSQFLGLKKRRNIKRMLIYFGMQFEGRLHSGIVDSRNIARIAVGLLDRGCVLDCNESIENPTSLLSDLIRDNA